jgi:prephenate dehydrogenase
MSPSGFKSRHLAVVGLGLMGGSMAIALRERCDIITGMDMNPETRRFALDNKIVDNATDDLYSAVHQADTVILAAPVRIIIEMLQKHISTYLRSNTLLIDIGSTKADICEAMARLPVGVGAIGGHPMAGKENSGIQVAEGNLFRGRPFVLCRTRRTTPASMDRARLLVEALEAEAIEMEAERHDRIVAGISHLPYMLSASLVGTIAKEAAQDDAFWKLAAGGFRDTSRLAGSDIKMMGDILSTNTRAVATLLAMFRVQLAVMETMLIAGEYEKLIESLIPVRQARLDWAENYEQKRSNGQSHHQAGQPTKGKDESSGG